jgi:hypothetical protein
MGGHYTEELSLVDTEARPVRIVLATIRIDSDSILNIVNTHFSVVL